MLKRVSRIRDIRRSIQFYGVLVLCTPDHCMRYSGPLLPDLQPGLLYWPQPSALPYNDSRRGVTYTNVIVVGLTGSEIEPLGPGDLPTVTLRLIKPDMNGYMIWMVTILQFRTERGKRRALWHILLERRGLCWILIARMYFLRYITCR